MFFDRLTDKSEFWPGLEKQDLEQGENIYRYVKSCLLKYKYRSEEQRLNSSHFTQSRMPSSA